MQHSWMPTGFSTDQNLKIAESIREKRLATGPRVSPCLIANGSPGNQIGASLQWGRNQRLDYLYSPRGTQWPAGGPPIFPSLPSSSPLTDTREYSDNCKLFRCRSHTVSALHPVQH